ncbi:MAG: acetyl-CoA carboxylase biotin carboxyl carrier protein subunit [Solirubrobacteraceae bacterium]|nr:acetyl-CoA carboxylase biotin carboxyl carrier protein subunit [Patulibacter sp.]
MSLITSNITGTIFEINVEVGQEVAVGDEVVIVESMKMELAITAETAGTVAEILVEPNQPIEVGGALIRLA